MNGQSAVNLGPIPSEAKVNRDLVKLLEAALNDARAGRMVAGGVVAVIGPSQFMAYSAMSVFPAECIAGAAVMTSDVIMKMRQPRPGGLVRAGALPS